MAFLHIWDHISNIEHEDHIVTIEHRSEVIYLLLSAAYWIYAFQMAKTPKWSQIGMFLQGTWIWNLLCHFTLSHHIFWTLMGQSKVLHFNGLKTPTCILSQVGHVLLQSFDKKPYMCSFATFFDYTYQI